MSTTVRVCIQVDLDRIRQVIPLEGHECQVLYEDAAGRLVSGTVAASAETLRDLIDAVAGLAEETERNALMACSGLG